MGQGETAVEVAAGSREAHPGEAPRRGALRLFEPICPSMWSVTPYARCDFRCVYCCTGAQGASSPLLDASAMADEVSRMLDVVADADLLILGAFSDAYPSVEAELGVTRPILERLVAARRRFSIVTKGTTVLRDVDLLLRAPVGTLVQISICSTDDEALARLDPGAPSGSARFALIRALHEAGIRVELNALPYVPDVSDLDAMLARLPAGVGVVLSPLAFGERETMRLLGRTYERSAVWARYLAEYRRLGHLAHTSWVRPSLPPEENHPFARLPCLTAAPS